MKTLGKIYLIFAIILWVAAVVLCFIYSSFSSPAPGLFLVAFIPACLFSFFSPITLRTKNKLIHAVYILISCLLTAIWILVNVVWIGMFHYLETVTDVAQYEAILKNDWQPGFMQPFVKHFPKKLPEEKANIRFAYQRPFLQGGSFIQLRMPKTKQEINDLYSQFVKQKVTFPEKSDDPKALEPKIRFMTGDSKDNSFPKDFEIMIFHSKRGNHGQNYGVAISKKRNEIVYFAEYW